MEASRKLAKLEADLRPQLQELCRLQQKIRTQIEGYANGKKLKGNEIVGWLGEIYGSDFLGGNLVDDSHEHDFEVGNHRVSVKTRKGTGGGWKRTGAIPTINGENCPTHLLFVHLNDDYGIEKMWLFRWSELVQSNRLTSHVVREKHRSYIFTLDPKRDADKVIYSEKHIAGTTNHLLQNPRNAERLLTSIRQFER